MRLIQEGAVQALSHDMNYAKIDDLHLEFF